MSNLGIIKFGFGSGGQQPIPPDAVTSVFGRTGNVVSQNNDYNASQIENTPNGNISSNNVQGALNELDSKKQPINDILTAISNLTNSGFIVFKAPNQVFNRIIQGATGRVSVTNGDGANANPIIDLQSIITAGTFNSQNSIPIITYDEYGRITDIKSNLIDITSGQVSDFTEAVQDVVGNTLVDSIDIDFIYNDLNNTLEAFLTTTGVVAGSYGTSNKVPVISVDNKGRVESVSETLISITSSQISDFNEAVQDVIGATMTDSVDIDLTYNDILGTVTALLTTTGVTSGTYGTASSNPQLTVDSKGRVTNITNVPISILSSQISDFTESTQDIVGAMLQDSTDIDFTYNDIAGIVNAVLTTTGVVSGTYGTASSVPVFTVDNKGRLSVVTNTNISIPSTQVNDFTEAVQDVIGNFVTDSSTIDFVYNDVLNTLTASIVTNSISNDLLSQVPTQTFKGRTTAGTGNVEDLTATQATALLDIATVSLKGLMSASDKTKLDSIPTTLPNVISGYLTATQANSTVTPSVLTNHTITIPAGKSASISGVLIFTSAATTTGLGLGIRCSQGVGANGNAQGSWSTQVQLSSASSATGLRDGDIFNVAGGANTLGEVLGTATVAGNNSSTYLVNIKNNSTNAVTTVTIEFRSEVAGSAVTAQIGSGFNAIIG